MSEQLHDIPFYQAGLAENTGNDTPFQIGFYQEQLPPLASPSSGSFLALNGGGHLLLNSGGRIIL